MRGKHKRAEDSARVLKKFTAGFPTDSVVKNLPANAGDTGSIPGQGGSHSLQSS